MKLLLCGIDHFFETRPDKVDTIVIENQQLYYRVIRDLYEQMNGNEGKSVLSEQNKILPMDKNLELINSFVPFEVNKKNLQNKVIAQITERAAIGTEYYETMELMSQLEKILWNLTNDMKGDIVFEKLSFESIVKAIGVAFSEEYDSLGEKVIDYFELVTEFDRKKLFVTNNLRCYLSDKETSLFLDTVLAQGYHLVMIEGTEHPLLPLEARFIVDSALCEIG